MSFTDEKRKNWDCFKPLHYSEKIFVIASKADFNLQNSQNVIESQHWIVFLGLEIIVSLILYN